MITFRLWLENSAQISQQELGKIHTNANAFQSGQYVLLQTMSNTHIGRIGKDQQGVYIDENEQRIYLNQTQGVLGIFRPYKKGERVQEEPPANRSGVVTNDSPYGLYVQWDNETQPSSVNRLSVTPETTQTSQISRQELGKIRTNANAFQSGQYVLLQTMGNIHVGRIGKDRQGVYVDENDQKIYLNQTQGVLGVFRPYKKGERVQEGPPANRSGVVTNDNPYGLYVQWDNENQPSSVNRLSVEPQTT